jgi:polysaccharide pyruvyl transferase WcaK-like protein
MILKLPQHLDIFLKCGTLYGWVVTNLAKIVPMSKRGSLTKRHYLILAPTSGSVGDQAMCDAFAVQFDGNCIFIVQDAKIFTSPTKYNSQIILLEIPKLVYGGFFGNFHALLKLAKHRSAMKSLSLIGADVMDGSYNLRASVNRLFILRIMNNLNVPTRITGFSWSANAKGSPQSLIKNISEGTKLLVRDPRSAARLRASGTSKITECTDLVFSDQSEDATNPVHKWIGSDNRAIVGVNISGLAFNAQSQMQFHEYVKIVKYIKGLDYRVLVIPHDFRATDGDLEVSRKLFQIACDDEDYLISEIFTAAQERSFLRKANFFVTGRMHGAIIALSVGVPAIALETMGKVEGLFELFDNKSYCIRRDIGFSKEVIIRIDELHQNHDEAVRKIEGYLPSIKALSSLNFEDL